MKPKRQRIRGAKHTKGRFISGHIKPIEERTFQETEHLESVDRTMRKWRAEPKADGPSPEDTRLVARLRDAISGVDANLLGRERLGMERRTKPEPKAPKGGGSTVERTLGGWVYTIRWPSGEIIDKRKEV